MGISNTVVWRCFVVLSLIYLLPTLILDLVLITEVDYYNYFLGKLSGEQVTALLAYLKKWRWLSYLSIVVVLFLKTLIVGAILWLAVFMTDRKLKFSTLWKVAILAQFVFALKSYVLLFQAMFSSDFDLEKLQSFTPLSLASLFDLKALETYLAFLFQSLNIFEVAYWFILAYLLSREINRSYSRSLQVVMGSYGPAFLLWLCTVIFLLVSNS